MCLYELLENTGELYIKINPKSVHMSQTDFFAGMQAIDAKILSLNYGDFRAEIRSVDAQESLNGGVDVLVTGYLTGKDNVLRNFTQSFFLAPQDKGFFVLNDMFRYMDLANHNEGDNAPTEDVVTPVTHEQGDLILYLFS